MLALADVKERYMKKLALALGVAVVLVSCSEGKEVNSETTLQSEHNASDIDIKVIEIRGHEYVILDGYKQGGICHAESCPCKSK
jgi:hypothetical protein